MLKSGNQLQDGYLERGKKMLFFFKYLDSFLKLLFNKNRSFPEEIRKILIIKPDHMGDLLLLTAVFPLITNRFPNAKIGIITNESSRFIIEHNPYIHIRYIVNHHRLNRNKIPEIKKLISYIISSVKTIYDLRKQKYNLCLIMRAYPYNLISLARAGNCEFIIGHATGGWGPMLDLAVTWQKGKHEIEHFLEVLAPLGIKTDVKKMHSEVYFPENIKISVEKTWNGFFKNEKVAIIHPGTGDLNRSLNVAQWKQIIKLLEEIGYKIGITGTKGEKLLAESIMSAKSFNLCGLFSIYELAHAFKKATLIVTVETFAAHLGAWSGTKTIAFYSGINDFQQWQPLGENVVLLKRNCIESPCCDGCSEKNCMDFEIEKLKNSGVFSDSTINLGVTLY
jgi:heptosyltransferase III